MNRVQIAILGVTVVAFGAAYVLFNSSPAPPPVAHTVQAPKIETDEVLVAAQDIPMGTQIGEASVVWQVWPKAAISEYMIVKSGGPNVIEDVKGSLTREPFLRGEPMRRDKLVKGGNSGFMSAILPTGMRAVAIKIDNSGDSSAGGFILPNDRVDVITIYRDDEATKARGVDSLRLANHPGQCSRSRDRTEHSGGERQEGRGRGQRDLGVDPAQAELIVLAQHAGNVNLHLALRSLADSAGQAERVGDASAARQQFDDRALWRAADGDTLMGGSADGNVQD